MEIRIHARALAEAETRPKQIGVVLHLGVDAGAGSRSALGVPHVAKVTLESEPIVHEDGAAGVPAVHVDTVGASAVSTQVAVATRDFRTLPLRHCCGSQHRNCEYN